MPPPPRPPIICYDLQSNENLRRAPCTRYRVPVIGANRKNKVTIVNREPSDLSRFTASSCCYNHNFEDTYREDDTENFRFSNAKTTPVHDRKQIADNNNERFVRVARKPRHHLELAQAEPYRFNKSPFAQNTINSDYHHHLSDHQRLQDHENRFNNNNMRFAYSKKLKHELEEKERRREFARRRLNVQNQLEDLTAEVDSAKRSLDYLKKTFGMSHNSAKYIQLQDEELGRLRRKINQCADIRSRELAQRDRQMKRSHELRVIEDQKAEERRMRDMSELTHCKRGLSSTLNNSLSSNSQNTNNANNTQSSSSTISISSCSSPMSMNEHIASVHFVESLPSSIEKAPHVSSSTPSRSFLRKNLSGNKKISHKPPDFTFYKRNPLENETIEVTDMDFFEKAEDKTMMEVNDLVSKIRNTLSEMNYKLQKD